MYVCMYVCMHVCMYVCGCREVLNKIEQNYCEDKSGTVTETWCSPSLTVGARRHAQLGDSNQGWLATKHSAVGCNPRVNTKYLIERIS